MARKSNNYAPEVPWAEHIAQIAERYPYQMPPAPVAGLHPVVLFEGKEYRLPGGGTPLPKVRAQAAG